MKKILCIMSMLAFLLSMQAAVSYSIDFRTGDISDWQIIDILKPTGLTDIWTQSASYGIVASSVVKEADEENATPAETVKCMSFLQSPKFLMLSGRKVAICFNHAMKFGKASQLKAHVYVEYAGGRNTYELEIPNKPSGDSWTFYHSGYIDLSSYAVAGNTISIMFEYSSEGAEGLSPRWEIKDFKLLVSDGTIKDVTYPKDFADWDNLYNETIRFTHPMTVCGQDYYGGYLLVAPSRLRAPEEVAKGFPTDSTDYYAIANENEKSLFYIGGVSDLGSIRGGAEIEGLTAAVSTQWSNILMATEELNIKNNTRPTAPAEIKDAKLKVCSANVENYFYWYGSAAYAGAKSEEKFQLQTTKLVSGLLAIDADLYALAEVGDGQDALTFLVDNMNNKVGESRYAYIDDGSEYSGSVKCAYIYRVDKLEPFGTLYYPYYNAGTYHLRELIQGFEEKGSGERFVVSINHFKAKGSYDTNPTRMTNVEKLYTGLDKCLTWFGDDDQLVLGDLNCYSKEPPIKYLTDRGYVDELMRFSPNDYSYVYGGTTGYLDHALSSESMSVQVVGAAPWHVNADEYSNNGYAYSTNSTMYRYSDHDPLIIGLDLGRKEAVDAGKGDGKDDGKDDGKGDGKDDGKDDKGNKDDDAEYYTVKFFDMDNITLLKEEEVKEGDDATAPTPPVHEGYVFTGWDKNFTNVTRNLKVYAEYERTNGIETVNAEYSNKVRKVIENGQVYIIKDGKKYTMLGTMIKE